jgi:hypothetical protein
VCESIRAGIYKVQPSQDAKQTKKDAARKRRNAGAKARSDARRLLGLKRTAWGWE